MGNAWLSAIGRAVWKVLNDYVLLDIWVKYIALKADALENQRKYSPILGHRLYSYNLISGNVRE